MWYKMCIVPVSLSEQCTHANFDGQLFATLFPLGSAPRRHFLSYTLRVFKYSFCFAGIVSDLFPGVKEEQVDHGVLVDAIRKASSRQGLQDVDGELASRRLGHSDLAERLAITLLLAAKPTRPRRAVHCRSREPHAPPRPAHHSDEKGGRPRS